MQKAFGEFIAWTNYLQMLLRRSKSVGNNSKILIMLYILIKNTIWALYIVCMELCIENGQLLPGQFIEKHHDNPSAHTSSTVKDVFAKNNILIGVIPQPPTVYQHTLGLRDFFIFQRTRKRKLSTFSECCWHITVNISRQIWLLLTI